MIFLLGLLLLVATPVSAMERRVVPDKRVDAETGRRRAVARPDTIFGPRLSSAEVEEIQGRDRERFYQYSHTRREDGLCLIAVTGGAALVCMVAYLAGVRAIFG